MLGSYVIFWFTVLGLNILNADGGRILAVFPMPGQSHQAVFRPIMVALAAKGHNVTFYTPFTIENAPETLKIIQTPFESLKEKLLRQDNKMNFNMMTMTSANFGNHKVVEILVQEEELQELFRSNETYDVVITSALYYQPVYSTLAHKFKAPMVNVVPVDDVSWMLETSGAPDNPSYMVDKYSTYCEKMSLFERISNTVHWTYTRIIGYYITMILDQEVLDKYIKYPGWESRPPLISMTADSALVLLNSHHSVGYAYPKPPHFKEIGGVNVVESKPLSKDLAAFLDSAKNGAVYFSMGSLIPVSEFAKGDVMMAFANVFKKLKLKVLWKWEQDKFPIKSPDIVTSAWFPQQDILEHKNMKVFITQGGMMSMYEAISRGVPLLGIPVRSDQFKNMKSATYKGFGIRLDQNNLTETSLFWALDQLINNPSYKKVAEKRAQLFHDRLQKPVDEAVYWIEYVLRHGRVLQPASVRLSFYQLYQLDVLFVFILAAIVLVKLVKKLFNSCINLFWKRKRVDKIKKH